MANKGPLPNDRAELMRLHCVRTDEDKRAFDNVVKDFFVESDCGKFLIQNGCEKTFLKMKTFSDRGKRGAKARWSKQEEDMLCVCLDDANEMQGEMVTNKQETITNKQEPIKDTLPKGRELSGKPPTCPHDEIISLFHEVLSELPQVLVWNKSRQGYAKQRWRELAIEKKWETQEQGLEYFRKLFKYIRGSKFLMGKTTSKDRRPFECTLEWILRPNNFANIIEGKYHEQT
jgi:uncharacterized protein YdaU (DUF1376 family)